MNKWECDTCFALVAQESKLSHQEWHEQLRQGIVDTMATEFEALSQMIEDMLDRDEARAERDRQGR